MVSATQGLSMDFLKMKIQEQVLRATGQRLWDIQLPSTGQHLRYLFKEGGWVEEENATCQKLRGGGQVHIEFQYMMS